MPTVIENIALEIVRRLEQITIAEGYSFDVPSVVRPDRLADYSPEDGMIVLKQNDSTLNQDSSHPGNPPSIAFDTEFEIECFVRASEHSDPTSYHSIQNERGGQIIKAITTEATDPGHWYTFDSNAILSSVGDVRNFGVSDGNHNGVTVVINVLHRQSENDPYQVRA